VKTKRKNECRSPFVLPSSDLYVGKAKWIYIKASSTLEEALPFKILFFFL